jgi:exopolysaccharide production protein ExoZ
VSQTNRLDSIQVLRAVAALLVAVSHIQKEIGTNLNNTGLDWAKLYISGQFGVDIFFVISGFIMVYVTKNEPSGFKPARDFFLKRVIRVVPLYWVMTVVTIVLSIVLSDHKNHNDLRPEYVAASFFFIPWLRIDGNFTPVLGVGWTLNFEMLFYVLFAAAMLVHKKLRLLTMTVIFVSLALAGLFIARENVQIWIWTRQIIIEFLLGAFIANALLKGFSVTSIQAWIMFIVGVVWWQVASHTLADPTDSEVRLLGWGVPAALIFAAVVLVKRNEKRASNDWISVNIKGPLVKLFTRIGDGSYSLYIFHMFVVRLVSLILPKDLITWQYIVCYYSLALFLIVISSDILFKYFERPANELGRKVFGFK